MLALKYVFIFLISIHFSIQEDNSEVFCSKSFCKVYTTQNTCRKIPEACRAQNATHSGVYLPSDAPCSCCKYCLENVNIGKECEKTSSQSGQTSICGDGLSCVQSGSIYTCQKMITAKISDCTREQALYDEKRKAGTLGKMELRPECDKDGNYIPVKCIPGQTCWCVSEDGKRIFGDIIFEANAQLSMKCGCSRHNYKTNKNFNNNNNDYSILRPRCLPNGDYDPLQCFNSSCVCVDKIDGTPDKETKVHDTLITKDNVACFDSSNHVEGEYYRGCEKVYKNLLDEIDMYQDKGYIMKGVRLPNCQQDGWYAPVQENDHYKYCVDPYNNPLKRKEKEYSVPKDHDLGKMMDCKCARANYLMEKNNIMERADCLENGNYNPIQCRKGLCYCVNSDGVQDTFKITEVNISDKDSLKVKCNIFSNN